MAISTIGSDGIATGAVGATQIAANSIDAGQLATAVEPIGVAQTWQNVAASRAISTTYTNTTGRPIMVAISQGSTTAAYYIVVSGVNVINVAAGSGTFNGGNGSVVVPAGATYSLSGGSFSTWTELR